MSMFHVGQQVVCIQYGRNPNAPKHLRHAIPGQVYTVRGFLEWGTELGIYVEEIINPLHTSGVEWAFYKDCFRPVKPTSIDVFRKLLSPIRERETV